MLVVIFLQIYFQEIVKPNLILKTELLQKFGVGMYATSLNKLKNSLQIPTDNMSSIITSLDSKNTNLFEHDGSVTDLVTGVKDDLVNGETSYNIDGYSREYRNMKNRINQVNQPERSTAGINRDLEYVYSELDYLSENLSGILTDGNKYYFRHFSLMKSFWDHSNTSQGGIISQCGDQFKDIETISITDFKNLPSHLSMWDFRRLLNRGHCGS